ncbi:MAG: hypothetical protein ACYC2H_01295 [Thermoplasmatota archaeon]
MAGFTTAAIIGGIVAGAGAVGGAAINASAAGRATRAQEDAAGRAMTIEQENELRRREEFDRTADENRTRWDIEQQREQQRYDTGRNDSLRAEAAGNERWKFDQERRGTARAAGRGAIEELSRIGGITLRPTDPPPDLAQGWSPESMSPPTSTAPFVPNPTPPRSTPPPSTPPPRTAVNRPMSDLAR